MKPQPILTLKNEAVIQSSVAKLVRGKTLLVIAHRLSTIADADNIIVISVGKVAEEGTHQQLLENGEIYKKMWQSHMGMKEENASLEKVGAQYA